MQQNRTSQEQFSRLIEMLKSETEAPGLPDQKGVRAASQGYRYPRSRWSAPSAD